MIPGFLNLGGARRPPPDDGFIEEVTVREPEPRPPWAGPLVLAAWLLILVKCFLVVWAIRRWGVPVHPAWVIVPTLLMAAAGTVLFLRRR